MSWVFLLESLVCGKDVGNGCIFTFPSYFRFPLRFFLLFTFFYFTRVINWVTNKVVSVGYSIVAYVGVRRCTIAINMGRERKLFFFLPKLINWGRRVDLVAVGLPIERERSC